MAQELIPGEQELWNEIYQKVLANEQSEELATTLADTARDCYRRIATEHRGARN